MKRARWALATVVVLLAMSAGKQQAAAQATGLATGQEIAARLVGKPLYLRGFWIKDELRFNTAGQIETPSEQAPFTESGINVRSVSLTRGKLLIKGQRMALEFLPDDQVQRVNMKSKGYPGKITIEIEGDTSDYSEALDAIFTDYLAGMTPTLPSYWQPYAKAHFAKLTLSGGKHAKTKDAPDLDRPAPTPIPLGLNDSSATTSHRKSDAAPMHSGGDVKPPKVLQSSDPDFTPVARALQYSGNVEIYLIVKSDGNVSHVMIYKPAGLGLDEAAVAAIEKYHFAPAIKDGKPVAVDLYIDVNFKIF